MTTQAPPVSGEKTRNGSSYHSLLAHLQRTLLRGSSFENEDARTLLETVAQTDLLRTRVNDSVVQQWLVLKTVGKQCHYLIDNIILNYIFRIIPIEEAISTLTGQLQKEYSSVQSAVTSTNLIERWQLGGGAVEIVLLGGVSLKMTVAQTARLIVEAYQPLPHPLRTMTAALRFVRRRVLRHTPESIAQRRFVFLYLADLRLATTLEFFAAQLLRHLEFRDET